MQPRAPTVRADDNPVGAVDGLRLELGEPRDQQQATTEVLSVVSRSPADPQPVFDTIAASATRLCDGLYSVVFRFDGAMLTVAADSGFAQRTSALIRSAYPAPPGNGTLASRALLERRAIAVTDAQDGIANPAGAERARRIGYRAALSVPMLKGDTAIGAINVVRREAIPFTDTQIELLQTFADHAVIAIENTRLFEAEQVRNMELKVALEQQTATSELLKVVGLSCKYETVVPLDSSSSSVFLRAKFLETRTKTDRCEAWVTRLFAAREVLVKGTRNPWGIVCANHP